MRHYLLLLLITISTTAFCQQKVFDTDWVKQFYSSASKSNYNVAADKSNNVYVIINYDTLKHGTINLSSANHASATIVKFDSKGELVWHYDMLDNANTVELTAIAVNDNGTSYVYGNYNGTLKLNQSLTLVATAGSSPFTKNTFLASINDKGELLWAKGFKNGDVSASLSTMPNNSVLLKYEKNLSGKQLGDSIFGNTTDLGMAIFTSTGEVKHIYLQDNFSNVISTWHVKADLEGNIYTLIALLGDSIKIGDKIYKKQDENSINYIIVKRDNEFNLLWVKNWQSVLEKKYYSSIVSANNSIATDANNNLYIANIFSGTITVEDKTLSTDNNAKLFIAKINTNGVLQWIRQTNSASGLVAGRMLGVSGSKVLLIASGSAISIDDIKNITGPAILSLDVSSGAPISANHWALQDGGWYVLGGSAHYAISSMVKNKEYFYKDVEYKPVGQGDLLLLKLDTLLTSGIYNASLNYNRLQVFPNPTNGKVHFAFKTTKTGEILSYNVCDVTGKTVISNQIISAKGDNYSEIKLDNLKNGLYFLIVKTKDGTASEKIILSK